ncbi:TOBE domain-containing protein [Nocardiopsis sp. NRRL B-16309]|uniref:TOBE domain-containing protein n=1 Tax=Nocardiopsis sp. NRRL B-16309 TaxID=1519494 RepID=UPI0006AE78DB|nr:TOBE domain-containing protein [Nocardiopsis sp. NRRL B-16309]KOX13233.1 hypothetical protein ADL05_20045 [Nocardiopsis sp. NRRL B-16309]
MPARRRPETEPSPGAGEPVVIPGEPRAGRVRRALRTLTPRAECQGPANEGHGIAVPRPERVKVAEYAGTSRAWAPSAREDGGLARVADVTFAGHGIVVHLVVKESATRVRARSHHHPAPEVGACVRVRVSGGVFLVTGDPAQAWEQGRGVPWHR